MPCISETVRCCGGTLPSSGLEISQARNKLRHVPHASAGFVHGLDFKIWKWQWYAAPKSRVTFAGLHGVVIQEDGILWDSHTQSFTYDFCWMFLLLFLTRKFCLLILMAEIMNIIVLWDVMCYSGRLYLTFLFCSENGGRKFLRNVGYNPPDYTSSYPRRQIVFLWSISGSFLTQIYILFFLRKVCPRLYNWVLAGNIRM
jgi:hypothetical protein